MHIIHTPALDPGNSGFKFAGMGILFDVKDHTADSLLSDQIDIIDKFFDSLEWTDTSSNPKVPIVPFGDLMRLIDMDTRWVYKGSMTEPPCETLVYWNVVRTIYPIKQKHLDLFLNQLRRGGKFLDYTGNWREIQPTTPEHELHIIELEPSIDNNGLIVGLIILTLIMAALSMICLASVIHYRIKVSQLENRRKVATVREDLELKITDSAQRPNGKKEKWADN